MTKQFWAVIIVLILAFFGVIALSGHKTKSSSSSSSQPTNHVEGQGKSGVTLVEYGDYECPYCGQYEPTVEQVVQQYNDQIYFQFRNFPLVSIHQNAFAAARAAEAAGLQGKFWQMHNLLYEMQSQWSSANDPTQYFDRYASQIGLNVSQFRQDYASDKVNNLINADTAAGNKLNINGTPTFFLDGKEVQIANNVDAFKKVLDAEIAKKAGTGSTQPASSTSTPPSSTTAQ